MSIFAEIIIHTIYTSCGFYVEISIYDRFFGQHPTPRFNLYLQDRTDGEFCKISRRECSLADRPSSELIDCSVIYSLNERVKNGFSLVSENAMKNKVESWVISDL